ncbi:hypothetical protein BCV70DRAFT_201538 [Testicularia cyperi]|uniref:Zn(2)-C6 fungal-type domain-containing protein n=1 Tax=Testicularia cyperi TaxID=1882483 RepID=A0A317XKD5_9BASI|nr:hypothetical protein BCV70DRAFT_201538 [Testicularia cyperi]
MSRPLNTFHSSSWAPSGAPEHPHIHSAYSSSAAGPSSAIGASSSYRSAHAEPWAARHSATSANVVQHPPTFAAAQPAASSGPSTEQPVIRTAHVTPDGTTIYAATGRKRKRLQKACVACHKAKRRCDGGLPCSNCDFSGRTCCYSDANGKMVMPTARVTNEAAQQPIQVAGSQHPAAGPSMPVAAPNAQPLPTYLPAPSPAPGLDQHSRMRSVSVTSPPQQPSTSSLSPKVGSQREREGSFVSVDDVAPEHRREMISIFFSQLHPFSCVLDEIAFLRDLSTSEVPAWLLMSMFALSARFQQGGTEAERERRFLNGEAFARTARKMIQQEDNVGFTLLDRPDVDLAMALCFLAAHEFGMGRLQRAQSYVGDAVRAVATLRLAEGNLPPSRKPHYSRDSFSSTTRRVTCERVVLLAWTLDMTISALSAQPSSVRREEILTVARKFGNTGDESRDAVTKAFVRLAEISSVFALVLDTNRGARRNLTACEDALQSWAESLGVDHKFDDYNLKQSTRMLEEPEASAASHRAWFWAQMHLTAESAVFLMEANDGAATERNQQKAAHGNIQLILSILGIAGRRNLFAMPALLICTEFNRPTPEVLRWWGTARQCWSLGERQIVDAANLFVRTSAKSGGELVSPGSDSLTLPRLSGSSVLSSSGSRTGGLPSIGRLPLPSLRLSPPLSAPTRSHDERGDARESLTALPSWHSVHSAASSPGARNHSNDDVLSDRSRSSVGSAAGNGVEKSRNNSSSSASTDSHDSSISPRSAPVELYNNTPNPAIYRPSNRTSSHSPPLAASQPPAFGKDPRDTWSPISSLARGEKRAFAATVTL